MDGPVLVRDLILSGVSWREINAMVASGRMRKIVRGVLVDPDHPDDLASRAGAIALARPAGAVAARLTAAWLHGLDVVPPGRSIADLPLEFIVPRGSSVVRRAGCHGFIGDVPDHDISSAAGVPVTTPLRTASDLGRYLPRLHAVAAIDAFAHAHLVDIGELAEAALVLGGRRNAARLRAAVEIADAGAESVAESWARVRLIDAGLPMPQTQIELTLPDGRLVRLDMGYLQWRVGVEFDGVANHSSSTDLEHDRRRREDLDGYGWSIVVARKGDVLPDHGHLPAEVAARLIERGCVLKLSTLGFLARRVGLAPRSW
jgi:hypothetical protein